MSLEETKLEGKQYHFLKSIQVDEWEELSGKWRTKLLYKTLQIRDQIENGVWSKVRNEKKPSEGKCELSRKIHSEGEHSIVTLNWSSDHSVRIALAWRVAKLKETYLEGWKSCLKNKEGNPGKEEELKSDLKSARFELQFVLGQSFLILSYHCIRHWNPMLIG